MTLEELSVIITANTAELTREISKANKSVASFGREADSASNSNAGLGKSFNLVKIGSAIAASAVVVAVGKIVKSSTSLAMSVIESENLVSVTFGNLTDDINTWSNNLENALGLNAVELRKNAGIFFNIANSMGVTRDNAYKLSRGLTVLAEDLASFYNISREDALLKLQSGISGEIEPLRRLGISIDENSVKQQAYKSGIAELGSELDTNQKILARYMLIMNRTSNAQGDLARTLESPANQIRILQSRLQLLSQTFGAIFIPILNAALPYLQAFVQLAAMAVKAISGLFGIGRKDGEAMANNMEDIGNGAEGVSSGLGDANKKAKDLKKTLAGFDELNVLQQPTEGGAVGGGAGSGTGGFALPEPPDYSGAINEQIDGIIANIKEKLVLVANVVKPYIDQIYSAVIKPIIDIISEAWNNLIGGISEAWDIHGKSILDGTKSFMDNLISYWGALIDNIYVPLIKPFIDLITQNFGNFFFTTIDNVLKLVNAFLPFVEMLSKVLKPAVSVVGTFIATTFKNIGIVVNAVIQGLLGVLTGLLKFITGVFTGNWKAAWSGVKDVFKAIVNSMWSIIKLVLNAVIDSINNFLGGINKIKIPDFVPKYGGTQINIPLIPRLATGGIVTGSTLANIGEAGREAVLPLENNTEWMDTLVSKIQQQPTNLAVYIGGDKIHDETIKYIKNRSLTTNINLMGL